MTYTHTQHAPLHFVFLAIAASLFWSAWSAAPNPSVANLLVALGGLFLVLDFSFQHLKVQDADDRLRIRFGPLPLFQTSIRYDAITQVVPARSSWIDGWGIHWVPGRGWTWNLWGFDCVEITTTKGRLLRVGTDDPQGLADFLRGRAPK